MKIGNIEQIYTAGIGLKVYLVTEDRNFNLLLSLTLIS